MIYFYYYFSLIDNSDQFTNFHKNPSNSYFYSFPLQTVFIVQLYTGIVYFTNCYLEFTGFMIILLIIIRFMHWS